ncbi:MAG: ATP-binding protein [Bacteroidia bacterium]
MNTQNPGESGFSLFSTQTGRVILSILALLLILIRFTQPSANSAHLTSQLLSWSTVFVCLSTVVLSFIYPHFRHNIYNYVLVVFFLFSLGFLNQIYLTGFARTVLSGFLVFSLTAAFYIQKINHLAIFQLFTVSTSVMIFFLLPDPPAEAKAFLFRFTGVQLLAFFILSSRIRALEKRIITELKYQNLIERLYCGVIQTNAEGQITMVNQQICRLTGLERDTLQSLSFLELVIPDDAPVASGAIAGIMSGQSDKFELRLRRTSGEPFWVKISASPSVGENDRISGAYMVMADISMEKNHTDNLSVQLRDLELINQELIRQKTNLEMIARKTTEELREPSKSILRLADTLTRENAGDNPLALAWVNEISQQTLQIQDKLEGLWMYVVSEVEKPIPEELNLADVLDEIRKNLQFTIRENHVSIITKDLPWVQADRMQMVRLFSHLIENAIRHRGPASPVIQIGYSLNEEREEYVFSVIDNGLGFSREEYERVFHLFKKDSGKDMKGIGMGLHICKKIVDNHKGRMWFTSSLGKGSSFFFSLPLHFGQDRIPALTEETGETTEETASKQKS